MTDPIHSLLDSLNLSPADEHNIELARNVHPVDWVNPTPKPMYNAVVIGSGATGLVSTAGIAGLGGDVAIIEKNLMGGDCLNVGCVPSKALIRSAHAAAAVRDAGEFGVEVDGGYNVNFQAVMERLRQLRTEISPNDSAERFTKLGADVFFGEARFIDRDCIEVNGERLRFRRAIIASGGSPFVPPIEGLDKVPYHTNETIFNLTELPERLLVVGGGPIGCELAQSFARLGSKVTQLEAGSRILSRDDPDASKIVMDAFKKDGVELRTNSRLIKVECCEDGYVGIVAGEGGEVEIGFDLLLLAVGRKPNVSNMGFEAAGVIYNEKHGIQIDDFYRTTNPRIYAAGDVASKWKFTHAADAMAGGVIANAFFFGRSRHSKLIVPYCTYTSPEIAAVGLSLEAAREQGLEPQVAEVRFNDVDRAILDGEDEGFIKMVYGRKGKILGATIVAHHAGDMISPIVIAMQNGIPLGKIGNVIHPYPTQGEALKKAANVYRKTLLTPKVANILRWILKRR